MSIHNLVLAALGPALVIVGLFWFFQPFMIRANQRLEKKLRVGDNDDYDYLVLCDQKDRKIRQNHLYNTYFEAVLVAGLAWVFATIYHLPVLKMVSVTSASVVIFHLVFLPFLVFYLVRRKNLRGW